MKIINVLLQIAGLYGLYFTGVYVQHLFHLFIPGSIIGMCILLLLLYVKIVKREWVEASSNLLISHLPLLFLPVTIGIVNYYSFVSYEGLQILFVVFVSTVIVMVASAKTSQYLAKKKEHKHYVTYSD